MTKQMNGFSCVEVRTTHSVPMAVDTPARPKIDDCIEKGFQLPESVTDEKSTYQDLH
jgi:hypothetical protein